MCLKVSALGKEREQGMLSKNNSKERVKNTQKLGRNLGDHWNVHRREGTRFTKKHFFCCRFNDANQGLKE